MTKPYDIIQADRDLAHGLGAGTTFEERVNRAALHRENHSVMAGEHIGQEKEDLIVLALNSLNCGDAEELAKKIDGSYYVVLTPFSPERAANMIRDRRLSTEYRYNELTEGLVQATSRDFSSSGPYAQSATFVPSERAAADARSFREQVALDAMKIMLAQGYFSGTPDVDAEKCWQLADELLAARDRIDSGQAAKDAAERAEVRAAFEKAAENPPPPHPQAGYLS